VNRWLLAMIDVIVVGGLAGLTVTGQEKRAATELRARASVVEDQNGKIRASLGVDTHGSPWLYLSDANGKTRAKLGTLADGSLDAVHRDEWCIVHPFDTLLRPVVFRR
jgi:hypothetical protein